MYEEKNGNKVRKEIILEGERKGGRAKEGK